MRHKSQSLKHTHPKNNPQLNPQQQHQPYDCISPWQTPTNSYILQTYIQQNIKKNKIPDLKQNLVNSFLEKIKKSSNHTHREEQHGKYQNIMKNTVEDEEEEYHNKGQQIKKKGSYQLQTSNKQTKQSITNTRNMQLQLIKYIHNKQRKTKNNTANQHQFDKYRGKQGRSLILTNPKNRHSFIMNNYHTIHGSPNKNYISFNQQQIKSNNSFQDANTTIKRIVTEQSKKDKPTYIKKKKNHTKMSIVDINQTVKQFQEQQQKYIQFNTTKKPNLNNTSLYLHNFIYTSPTNQNYRYTQQNPSSNKFHQLPTKNQYQPKKQKQFGYITYKFGSLKDRDIKKKKKSYFLDHARDQQISVKLHNILLNNQM